MKPIQTHSVIAIQRPYLWLLSLLAVICLILLALWFSFEYGRYVAGYDSADTDAYIDQLQGQLEEAQAEIVETSR